MFTDASSVLLGLDQDPVTKRSRASDRRCILASVNPDLVDDFGHFLNYEKRLAEECALVGLQHVCLSNQQLRTQGPNLVATFPNDSGYYALVRRGSDIDGERRVREFFELISGALARLELLDKFDAVFVFVYCGSSRLAAALASLSWHPRVVVTVNAFWDFLIEPQDYQHVSRIPFQRSVRLLAMSELHGSLIAEQTGLRFPSIPNPPPLLSDEVACTEIRLQISRFWSAEPTRVLVPGLMTLGKGRGDTERLYELLQRDDAPADVEYTFRDRRGEFRAPRVPNVRLVTGDLTDEALIAHYRRADIVLLPYAATTFAVRTSGALVDALVFGCIPFVIRGTWLAATCESLGVGVVLPSADPEVVLDAVRESIPRLQVERRKVYRGAVRYLAKHSWRLLVERVTAEATHMPEAESEDGSKMPAASSLLAVGNWLARAGQWEEASDVYRWLSSDAAFPVYRRNLEFSLRRMRSTPPGAG